MSKSPNKHNKIFLRVEPLSEEVIDMIRTGQLKEDMDKKELSRLLREKGWSTDDARSVVTVDPTGNMLSDETKGVQFIQESMDSIRNLSEVCVLYYTTLSLTRIRHTGVWLN